MKSLEIVDLMLKYKVYNDELVQQIKQDLEVLEIVRKHLKLKKLGGEKYQIFDLTIHNLVHVERGVFKDNPEFLKLKQWLEGNENA